MADCSGVCLEVDFNDGKENPVDHVCLTEVATCAYKVHCLCICEHFYQPRSGRSSDGVGSCCSSSFKTFTFSCLANARLVFFRRFILLELEIY